MQLIQCGLLTKTENFSPFFFGILLIRICFSSFPTPLHYVIVSNIGCQKYRPMTCNVAMSTVRGSLFLLLRVEPRAVTCVRYPWPLIILYARNPLNNQLREISMVM